MDVICRQTLATPIIPERPKEALVPRRKKWKWSGFSEKTLWDWLQLLGVLAIPLVLALGTLWFSAQQRQMSDAMMKNQHDTALAMSQQQRETAQAIAEDQPHDAILVQPACVLGEPLPCPKKHIVS